MASEGIADETSIQVEERIVLHKYDGDYTEEEIDRLQPTPVETVTIVVVNGEVVEHSVTKEE